MKQLLLKIDFPFCPPYMGLVHGDAASIFRPVPPSDEWSKIQISYEKSEQEGEYTLALALADEEVGRVEVDEVNLDSGIKIFIGSESVYDSYDMDIPEGYIRGLILLDK